MWILWNQYTYILSAYILILLLLLLYYFVILYKFYLVEGAILWYYATCILSRINLVNSMHL